MRFDMFHQWKWKLKIRGGWQAALSGLSLELCRVVGRQFDSRDSLMGHVKWLPMPLEMRVCEDRDAMAGMKGGVPGEDGAS